MDFNCFISKLNEHTHPQLKVHSSYQPNELHVIHDQNEKTKENENKIKTRHKKRFDNMRIIRVTPKSFRDCYHYFLLL